MTSVRLILVALAAALVFAVPAAAQIDSAPKVVARLMTEQNEIAPGGTVEIALEENIRPGWHTYWRNPGEAGLPTQIDWMLPKGWRAGAIEWPYPKRLPAGPLMNYGYEGTPWLLARIAAPHDAKIGDTVTLKAHASWLVCSQTICVPEDQDVSAPLAVVASPAPAYATIAQQFEAVRAHLPVPSPWPARFRLDQSLDLFLSASGLHPRAAEFFPFEEGLVQGSARQEFGVADSGIVLRLRPEAKTKAVHTLDGVLVLTSSDGSVQALTVKASPGPIPPAQFTDKRMTSLVAALFFALVGGLILNLMPCVLPVLAMKALSVASKAGADKREAAREGLAYGGGAILSFLVLGLAVIVLRAGGQAVGWGFQLQEPRVVAGFALLMFAVGLNLSGVFELPGISAGDALTRKGGVLGAFFTGVLAVAVAAPCTAPFMAAAIGYALMQSALAALAVFALLGLGFALPFIVIGLSPAFLRLLPRPGVWMLHFKQLLAFPMYGAAAWLVWVVAQEAGNPGLAVTLAAMIAFAFAVWVWNATRESAARWRPIGAVAAVLGLVAACVCVFFAKDATAGQSDTVVSAALHCEPYSAARLEQLRSERHPVFVDATAAWCITCLVNEKAALSNPSVTSAFARTRTAFLVADWTRRDAAVTALLAAHGRSGVPLYLYYRPGAADAEILPQVLTPEAVLAAVNRR